MATFSDDFAGTGALDPAKWDTQGFNIASRNAGVCDLPEFSWNLVLTPMDTAAQVAEFLCVDRTAEVTLSSTDTTWTFPRPTGYSVNVRADDVVECFRDGTTMGHSFIAVADGSIVRVEHDGAGTIDLYDDDVLIRTWTDGGTPLAGTRVWLAGGVGQVDNFSVQDIGGATPVEVEGAIGSYRTVGVGGEVALGELEIEGATGTYRTQGVAGEVGLGALEVEGAIGTWRTTGVPGEVELGAIEVEGAIGTWRTTGVPGEVELGALEVEGAIGTWRTVGVAGAIAGGPVAVVGAIGTWRTVGVAGAVEIPGDIPDICVTFGSPVFATHAAGSPTLLTRDVEGVFLARAAGSVDMVERDAGDATFGEGAPGSPTTSEHEAGTPVLLARSATLALGHGQLDNTLVC